MNEYLFAGIVGVEMFVIGFLCAYSWNRALVNKYKKAAEKAIAAFEKINVLLFMESQNDMRNTFSRPISQAEIDRRAKDKNGI